MQCLHDSFNAHLTEWVSCGEKGGGPLQEGDE